jgi:hypothetical protein
MAPSRTSTVKSKHAANKSGIKNSKTSSKSKSQSDPVSKPKKKEQQSKGVQMLKKGESGKKKRRVYSEKELGVPQLNMITPVGVEKPKGKKKGKVFVDDRVCSPSVFFLYQHQKLEIKVDFGKIGINDDNPRHGKRRQGRTDRV